MCLDHKYFLLKKILFESNRIIVHNKTLPFKDLTQLCIHNSLKYFSQRIKNKFIILQ